jgi:hypothetical protein
LSQRGRLCSYWWAELVVAESVKGLSRPDTSFEPIFLLLVAYISCSRHIFQVLVVPGFLTLTDFVHRAFTGGPQGELLQWADLIAALYILGHSVSLRYDIRYVGYE